MIPRQSVFPYPTHSSAPHLIALRPIVVSSAAAARFLFSFNSAAGYYYGAPLSIVRMLPPRDVSKAASTNQIGWAEQGPAFIVGVGHSAIHWIAAFFYLLIPFIGPDLGLSYTDTGLLVSVFHISSWVANFGSGLLVDITGRRMLFQIVSLLIGGFALLAFGWTSHLLVFLGVVILLGMSNNLWHPPAIAYLSEHYPRHRGRALAIHALGANLGDTLAPIAAGVLLASYSWQQTSIVATVPVLLIGLLIGFTLLPKEGRTQPHSGKSKSFVDIVSDLKALLRNRAITGLAVASGCRNIAQNGLYLFLPLYLINELKTGAIWMGLVMMALQIGGLVSGPVAGIWSDRAGRRPVMLWGLAGSAVLLALITPFPSTLVVTLVVTVAGCFLFSVRPVVHSWMMDLSPPTYFGTTTSILFGTQAIMTVVAMPIGGLIADSYGLASVFYFLAAMVLIAYLLVLLLPIQATGEPTRT